MAKTNLEKSHSKLSNSKLTLLCVLAAVLFTVLWVGVAMSKEYEELGITLMVVGGVGSVLSCLLFNAFKR